MTMPFGKYKGHDLDQIKRIDPDYVRWCIANLDGAENIKDYWRTGMEAPKPELKEVSQSSPIHNLMQMRWRKPETIFDNGLCLPFFHEAYYYDQIRDLRSFRIINNYPEYLTDYVTKELNYKSILDIEVSEDTITVQGKLDGGYSDTTTEYAIDPTTADLLMKAIEDHKEAIGLREIRQHIIKDAPIQRDELPDRSFCEIEVLGYIDVVVGGEIPIELKPTMGDDYPDVLRQITYHQQKLKSCRKLRSSHYIDPYKYICVVGTYTGIIPFEDLQYEFEQKDIKLVLEKEVA